MLPKSISWTGATPTSCAGRQQLPQKALNPQDWMGPSSVPPPSTHAATASSIVSPNVLAFRKKSPRSNSAPPRVKQPTPSGRTETVVNRNAPADDEQLPYSHSSYCVPAQSGVLKNVP